MLVELAHLVDGIDGDAAAPAVELLEALRQIGHLADGGDHHVAFDLVFRAVDRLRHGPLHRALAHSQRARPAVLALDDFQRHDRALDFDALALGVLAFVLGRRHLLDREQRGQRDLRALATQRAGDVMRRVAECRGSGDIVLVLRVDMAETARDRGDVDRRVAAADDHDFLGGRKHPAAVERVEEFDAGDAVFRIRARHGQRAAGLRANAPEDGVVIALELFDAHILADAHAGARTDAVERENAADLGVQHLARRAIAGNAETHHAAEFFMHLEDRDGMAFHAQEIGRCETGGTAADHRDLLAGKRRRRRQVRSILDRPVADILLDRVDADEIVDLVAVATVLAGRGAHAAHRGRERIGGDHALEGVLLPRHAGDRRLVHAARDLQPAANVMPGRATALARRRAMHVGRALVGLVGLENLCGQIDRIPHALAVLETAMRRLGIGGLVVHRRLLTPQRQQAAAARHILPPVSNR